MGLTFQSTQNNSMIDLYEIEKQEGQYVIALAGNPNVGKSSVFNSLTGLHQHTGNWPGKTVVNARGEYEYNKTSHILVDLPGTYSLFAASQEEEVARDFICFGNADAVIVVCDATCLERNLNLVYQITELRNNVILCINLMDEAKRKKITVDGKGIEKALGIPVVLCSARKGEGLTELKETVYKVLKGEIVPNPKLVCYSREIESKVNAIQPFIDEIISGINTRWISLRLIDGDTSFLNNLVKGVKEEPKLKMLEAATNQDTIMLRKDLRDEISKTIYEKVEAVTNKYVTTTLSKVTRDHKIDNYITSRVFGIPLMIALLALVFWITIAGANVPSSLLADFLFFVEDKITILFEYMNAPQWLHGLLVLGLYRTMAWVVSVMLPPMAIFFPLFTILEDLGYLPRVAFNLDHLFKKACAHGKQCLTMCMGFGCNAAGIISCRIIDSPRERLIAILTNNFVPCNGRFPTLIAIATIFFAVNGGKGFGIVSALTVTLLVILGIGISLLVSYLLSKTLLKGVPSTFTLELPPYRLPKIGRLLYTSIIDRTLFVLKRALIVAAPAGLITWLFANIYIGDLSVLAHTASFLDPFAKLLGLDGYILMAFLLGIPANEIVLPILLMSYLSTGSMVEFSSLDSLRAVLIAHNWTYLTALNVMLFSLLHWPCATTLMTIKKETGSVKWTLLGAFIPTAIAIGVCLITTFIYKIFTFI
ncbi:MAG: ferrous iron transporter [Anaerocolumna sp.]|nr:ferrous iron transporter [Anaerocolumna sp.]